MDCWKNKDLYVHLRSERGCFKEKIWYGEDGSESDLKMKVGDTTWSPTYQKKCRPDPPRQRKQWLTQEESVQLRQGKELLRQREDRRTDDLLELTEDMEKEI